jgi:hypothetical protein
MLRGPSIATPAAASTVIELGSGVGVAGSGGDDEAQPMLSSQGRSTASPGNPMAGGNSSLSAYLVGFLSAFLAGYLSDVTDACTYDGLFVCDWVGLCKQGIRRRFT